MKFLPLSSTSPTIVLSEQGKPLTAFEYLPYGETWLERVQPSLKEKHNPKYNSQELDTETDFYYYNARYYDPEISRFVTTDDRIPDESSSQSWNRYMYCNGSPIIYKDPTGHEFAGEDVYGQTMPEEKSGSSGRSGGSNTEVSQKTLDNMAEMRKSNKEGLTFVLSKAKNSKEVTMNYGDGNKDIKVIPATLHVFKADGTKLDSFKVLVPTGKDGDNKIDPTIGNFEKRLKDAESAQDKNGGGVFVAFSYLGPQIQLAYKAQDKDQTLHASKFENSNNKQVGVGSVGCGVITREDSIRFQKTMMEQYGHKKLPRANDKNDRTDMPYRSGDRIFIEGFK